MSLRSLAPSPAQVRGFSPGKTLILMRTSVLSRHRRPLSKADETGATLGALRSRLTG